MHQLLVVILKKSDVVDTLMQRLAEEGIKGGSVIETSGMAKSLKNSDLHILDTISEILGAAPVANSKMIMIALPEEKLETAKDVVHEVCGDLTKPNAGVMFALPISYSEGIN